MRETKQAQITGVDAGGFTAIASTGSIDRDGEVIIPGAFSPLPKSIPVHLGHIIEANNVVARAVPYYDGNKLMIDARFGSGSRAKQARRDVQDGILDSVSIVFIGAKKKDMGGVPTIVGGELIACDLVSIPSNRDARVLSARSYRGATYTTDDARADALLALAEAEIADAEALLKSVSVQNNGTTAADVRRFLRSL